MPPGDAAAHSRAASWTAAPNRSPRSGDRLPDVDANTEVDGPLGLLVPVLHGALDGDAGLHRGRHGSERGHDPVAGVLHLPPPLPVQGGAHDLVVFADQEHEAFIAQFLCLLRRVAQVGEQDHTQSGIDIRVPRRMSGKVAEKVR